MKATEQYFPVVLFIMLYKVVLTFETVDEIINWDHSNESYWAVLSCGAVYFAVEGVSSFESVHEIRKYKERFIVVFLPCSFLLMAGFVQSLEFMKKYANLQTSLPDLEKVWNIIQAS